MSKSDHFLFYTTEISDNVLVLGSDEVAHITTVLRFGAGDEIQVTDGKGTIFYCRIEKMKRDRALCAIISRETHTPKAPEITLYAGVPDRDRIETLCDELPPLGVSKIVPVITTHCNKSWWAKQWEKSLMRFERKIISSIKQSMNPFRMTVEKPISFEAALEQAEGTIIYCDENGASFAALTEMGSPEKVSLFIGSPSGFTPEEKEILVAKGKALALAPYRLRTELAATAAVSLLNQWRL